MIGSCPWSITKINESVERRWEVELHTTPTRPPPPACTLDSTSAYPAPSFSVTLLKLRCYGVITLFPVN